MIFCTAFFLGRPFYTVKEYVKVQPNNNQMKFMFSLFTNIFYRSHTLNQSSNEELLKNDTFRYMTEILEAVNAKESFSDLAILVNSLFNVFERYIVT